MFLFIIIELLSLWCSSILYITIIVITTLFYYSKAIKYKSSVLLQIIKIIKIIYYYNICILHILIIVLSFETQIYFAIKAKCQSRRTWILTVGALLRVSIPWSKWFSLGLPSHRLLGASLRPLLPWGPSETCVTPLGQCLLTFLQLTC